MIRAPRLGRSSNAVLAGLLLAGVLAGSKVIDWATDPEVGPVRVPFRHGWSKAAPVGHVFTDGMEVLEVTGSESIHVTDVRIEGEDELDLVGALMVPHVNRDGIQQYFPNFPPEKQLDTVPVVGATIAPTGSPGFELLLGIRANEAGRFIRSAVIIDYTVGAKRFVARLPAELVVCGYQPPAPAPECNP
jgi:hypothetical protein